MMIQVLVEKPCSNLLVFWRRNPSGLATPLYWIIPIPNPRIRRKNRRANARQKQAKKRNVPAATGHLDGAPSPGSRSSLFLHSITETQ
jgi:hypothetical protein